MNYKEELTRNMKYFRTTAGEDMFHAMMRKFTFCGDVSIIPACLVEIYE